MKHREQIERLFKTHFQSLFDYALALLHDEEAARDIVQDVFMSVLENNITDITEYYLLMATRNKALNHIRTYGIHQRILKLYFLEIEEYDKEDVMNEETIKNILECIDTCLTSQERQIMKLRFESGMKFSEISRTLGLSETAIYRHTKRAIHKISQKLKENG